MAKTKIIATLGPASESPEMINNFIKAGVSIFRFNMKHNDLKWHKQRIQRVRRVSHDLKKPVAILMDIQGPEVRVGYLPGRRVVLKKNEEVIFTNYYREGQQKVIMLDNLKLIQSLEKGHQISLANGTLKFEILGNRDGQVKARVIQGGLLEERKGVNFPGIDVDLPTLTNNDLENLKLASSVGVDFVALSFVRSEKDVLFLKKQIKKLGFCALVVAKIETKKAIENFDKIVAVSDAIMVARGDLAVELAYEKVPYFQKEMIRTCRTLGKPVIVATEMLETMTKNPQPTRAEISDVANAVYDSADALMLSGESATGQYPFEAVKTMVQVIDFIESKRPKEIFQIEETDDITEAMAKIAFQLSQSYFAEAEKIKAFVVLTDTGRTPRLLSRYRPNLPIIAIANDPKLRNQLELSYATKGLYFRFPEGTIHSVKKVMAFLKEKNILKKGEKAILIHGESWGTIGRTNTVRVQEVY